MSHRAARTERSPWVAYSLLAVTAFVLVLDAAIVNVALPSIREDLNFSQKDLAWVTNGYILTFGGFLLLGGRLSDLMGRRRIFMIGVALFTLASLACALAPTSIALVIARFAQGVGAAIASPAALSLILTLFSDATQRNKALGLWGAIAGMGAAAGSILGGILTDWLSWEAVFWVNVPIGVLVLALAPSLLPKGESEVTQRNFDFLGAVTVTAGLGVLVYTLIDASEVGWSSATTLWRAVLAVALLTVFLVVEARSKQPLLPLRIFRTSSIRNGNLITLALTATMFPSFFFITLYLQQVLDMSPLAAGMGQLPMALMFALGGPIVSRLVTRFGYKPPLVAGVSLISTGALWLSRIEAEGSWAVDVLGPIMVMGAGGALAFISTMIAATSGAAPEDSGIASGLVNTTQQIGGALGLAVLVSIANTYTNDALADGTAPLEALSGGFSRAILIASGVAALAAVAAIILIKSPKPATLQDAEEPEQPKEEKQPELVG